MDVYGCVEYIHRLACDTARETITNHEAEEIAVKEVKKLNPIISCITVDSVSRVNDTYIATCGFNTSGFSKRYEIVMNVYGDIEYFEEETEDDKVSLVICENKHCSVDCSHRKPHEKKLSCDIHCTNGNMKCIPYIKKEDKPEQMICFGVDDCNIACHHSKPHNKEEGCDVACLYYTEVGDATCIPYTEEFKVGDKVEVTDGMGKITSKTGTIKYKGVIFLTVIFPDGTRGIHEPNELRKDNNGQKGVKMEKEEKP